MFSLHDSGTPIYCPHSYKCNRGISLGHNSDITYSRVSYQKGLIQKGPTCHAYAWQIGTFGRITSIIIHYSIQNHQLLDFLFTTLYQFTQRKHQSSALLAFCAGNPPVTSSIPTQRASNAGSVSMWWHHHRINAKIMNNFRNCKLLKWMPRIHTANSKLSNYFKHQVKIWSNDQKASHQSHPITNYHQLDHLFNRLFMLISNKTQDLCINGSFFTNPPMTKAFPWQRDSYSPSVSMSPCGKQWTHIDDCSITYAYTMINCSMIFYKTQT